MDLRSIKDLNLTKKRVFLRADLNIPLEGGIHASHRLEAILPTIDFIRKHDAKIILATHIGRPDNLHIGDKANFFEEELSTKLLEDWFESKGYKIEYEVDLLEAIEKSTKNFDTILLLENLRFFKGERETNLDFAKLLAQCADVYVNDAFGVLHRNDTSVTLLAEQFETQGGYRGGYRGFGLLVEKEIETFQSLKENPSQPFIIVIGGNKIKTKMAALEQLLEQPDKNRVQKILIGGAIANEFLKGRQRKFLEKAKSYGVEIILPIDTQDSLDIGPKTIELFEREMEHAGTIFTSGVMGVYEKPEYSAGTEAILRAIAKSGAKTIVGGGDATAAAYEFGVAEDIDFLSTGGGAALAVLAAKNIKELPAVEAME
jgi:phosphoglycerate kinase